MTATDKTMRIDCYQSAYADRYGFEATMVKYRQRLVLERVHAIKPEVVVEIGCGKDLIYKHYLQYQPPLRQWLIVEPSPDFHRIAIDSRLPNLIAIHGFFEDQLQQLAEHMPEPPDMIILSSVLHEVPSPSELLAAIHRTMAAKSLLHVNVPNANSLHRLLAKSMGLISDTSDLSSRNVDLLQHRVYDAQRLRNELQSSHLAIIGEGGYFVKPFTHEQMLAAAAVLGEAVLDGLYQLGKEHPQMASEIYVEARKA